MNSACVVNKLPIQLKFGVGKKIGHAERLSVRRLPAADRSTSTPTNLSAAFEQVFLIAILKI